MWCVSVCLREGREEYFALVRTALQREIITCTETQADFDEVIITPDVISML